jgi:hypothetical protein
MTLAEKQIMPDASGNCRRTRLEAITEAKTLGPEQNVSAAVTPAVKSQPGPASNEWLGLTPHMTTEWQNVEKAASHYKMEIFVRTVASLQQKHLAEALAV